MKLTQKNRSVNQIPNCKLVLATSLVLFVCTQVEAQPFNDLRLEQSLTFNPNGQSNKPAAPDDVSSFGAQTGSLILAAPPPPPGTGAPRDPRPGAGSGIFKAPPPPTGTGAPRRRRGGGSRGCEVQNPISEEKPLTALVPEVPTDEPPGSKSVGGYTTGERPTFWFYVPYQPPITGEFVLREQDGTLVYKTAVTLPAKPGAIALSLPSSVAPLTPGKLYYWYFKLRCQPDDSPFSFVEGWIQRTALNPALESQLQNATPQQKIALYASNGIWYEALTIAAELYRNNPNDTNWTELLKDVGLGEIASEAIVVK